MTESRAHRKVLLIGWDAADWKIITPLLERGEMPNLERFINGGVMGNLATLQPVLSPMLWNSIGTGMLADRHGILGFTTVDPQSGRIRPFGSMDRKVKAIWNILSQEGFRTHVVNWFAGHPAENINGICISEIYSSQMANGLTNGQLPPLASGAIQPEKFRDTLSEIRVAPEEIEPDIIRLFVPRFAEIDQDKDRQLEILAKHLSECFTTHAAVTWILENEPWDFTAVYYPAIDHICHGFMKYHPPRQKHVPETEFEYYHDVVNSTYRLHDLMLGRLLQLAGEDATVILCSDHGYHSDHLRPAFLPLTPTGATQDHRSIGILAMKGPGLKRDELIHGASLLDITPTILQLFGLPIGQDMSGRPLIGAFSEPPKIEVIPSWENVNGSQSFPKPVAATLSAGEEDILLQQFAALGYIAPVASNNSAVVALTEVETKWNLARVYVSSLRFVSALPLLEEIYEAFPLRFDFGLVLAQCQFRVGLKEEASAVLHNLASVFPHRPIAALYLGILEYELGHMEEALQYFHRVQQTRSQFPDFYNYLGMACLRVNRLSDAEAAFAQTLAMDSQNALALVGQTQCLLRRDKNQEARETALQAVALNFSLPQAHYVLGMALARLGEINNAIQAFETCCRFNPRHLAALRCMIRLCGKEPALKDKAQAYRQHYQRNSPYRFTQAEQTKKLRALSQARAREREANRQMQEMLFDCDETEATISAEKTMIIVSGLPRSGTSLMMQMLAAGGIPPMTDRERKADEDNPEGYFEWEEIKQIGKQPALLKKAEGKAIKVISMLLPQLPFSRRYKVIFMNRSLEETAASQAKMLAHRSADSLVRKPISEGVTTLSPDMTLNLQKHRDETVRLLQAAPHMEVCVIEYAALVKKPEPEIARLISFLGAERIVHPHAMKNVIKPELYRNRISPTPV